jgi:hypothetical protein
MKRKLTKSGNMDGILIKKRKKMMIGMVKGTTRRKKATTQEKVKLTAL